MEPSGDVNIHGYLENTELTVMHLEEDKNGEVKQVVDLADDNVTNGAVEKLQTNENKQEKNFSYSRKNATISIHYVEENGKDIQKIIKL